MVTFDFALDMVMKLPQSEREDLIEILKKRNSLQWRKETAEYYQELKKDIDNGNIQPLNVNEVISELHNYIKSPE